MPGCTAGFLGPAAGMRVVSAPARRLLSFRLPGLWADAPAPPPGPRAGGTPALTPAASVHCLAPGADAPWAGGEAASASSAAAAAAALAATDTWVGASREPGVPPLSQQVSAALAPRSAAGGGGGGGAPGPRPPSPARPLFKWLLRSLVVVEAYGWLKVRRAPGVPGPVRIKSSTPVVTTCLPCAEPVPPRRKPPNGPIPRPFNPPRRCGRRRSRSS
jgi:hypothetical protein